MSQLVNLYCPVVGMATKLKPIPVVAVRSLTRLPDRYKDDVVSTLPQAIERSLNDLNCVPVLHWVGVGKL